MMKLWSYAVVIDTGVTVSSEEDYNQAAKDLDNALDTWATEVPISVYFKDVSEDTKSEKVHKIEWFVEAIPTEEQEGVEVFAILAKIMVEVKSTSKPDILKPNLRVSLLDKLAAVCPGLKVSKKFAGSVKVESTD